MSGLRAGLFVTGTDTGIGKTVVGSTLVRYWQGQGRRVGAYKPVASGVEQTAGGGRVWGDVEAYYRALQGEFSRERICPQTFAAPVAPPVAARQEGRQVDGDLLFQGAQWWQDQVEQLVVEGAGGLLSPLTETQTNADFAVGLGLPLLVVARQSLGTINHTLLTVEAAERRGLQVAGIVLNSAVPGGGDESVETNAEQLGRFCTAPILGVLPYSSDSDLLHHPAFLRMVDLLEGR